MTVMTENDPLYETEEFKRFYKDAVKRSKYFKCWKDEEGFEWIEVRGIAYRKRDFLHCAATMRMRGWI